MRKIIAILLSVLVFGSLLWGCGDKEETTNLNINQNDNSMISQSEKDSYKEEVKKVLNGLTLNDIEILTQNKTKKPIVMVQVIFDGTKGNINKSEVEEFIKTIKEKIETISNLYDITILDKNTQMIATTGYENEGKIYFFD
ncbi:hypothetical protein [Clostridium perfringens]|uniref:Lipoprotein n=2 Tax=Clostridium perfringens TaxID=1502 RepID=A0AAP7BW86_CLOPF|nr:hypothetical protein [Clostridium perfringens]NP_612850.1 Gp21 protein [Clostridium phage phi3626]AAL96791.1 Gp21 protein [Clostridium phage phi3626]EDT22119.1 Gp21 protein [Clostridium perfringens B str. ATCC 3626]EDT22908.1 Gp21 protein [Clostridium perfringens B str. ATCC 3626]NGU30592.1 hypothetical protein [Clostridium perfringens]WEV05003.1 hypothetical protein PL322_13615 [Clostridium perfringens B]